MNKIINIFYNNNQKSLDAYEKVKLVFEKKGFKIKTEFNEDAQLNICIGGDGSFLRGVHGTNFSKIPFVGVNTGTLGFYQEINYEHIDSFVEDYINSNYDIEKIRLLDCNIKLENEISNTKCLNEFVIKSANSEIIHLDIFIDDNHLETFAGDGLIISTPSGSTAYNMSAGGSIMYPNLKGYQLTPLAPIFSKVYRSITNSIVIPITSTLKIVPTEKSNENISFIADGIDHKINNISYFEIKKSKTKLYKLVFNKDWYWINMKDKFL